MDRPTSKPSPSSITPIRRRRFIFFGLLILSLIFFFGVSWEIPLALKDAAVLSGSGLSRANFVQLLKPGSKAAQVDEIYGLLEFLTSGDAQLSHSVGLNPSEPIDLRVYAGGKRNVDWQRAAKMLNQKYPVVIFSKVSSFLAFFMFLILINIS